MSISAHFLEKVSTKFSVLFRSVDRASLYCMCSFLSSVDKGHDLWSCTNYLYVGFCKQCK